MKKILLPMVCLYLLMIACNVNAEEKPLIGITPSFSNNTIQLNNDFISAINENGGIAIILPPVASDEIIENYVKMLDGAVFSGGPDIPSDYYNQPAHHTTRIMETTRFEFERRFIKTFLESGKPCLGVCLGMQFSNVVSGGTLIQDIPELVSRRVTHRNGEMYTNLHSIGIARGSRLADILGKTTTRVISRHHQAVEKTGNNLMVVARSNDGIIEALERKDSSFGIFVQWHPESMKDADPEHRNRLFSALIEASRNIKSTRNQN